MNYAVEKGEAGEKYVYDITEDVLNSLGIPYRVVQNAILPYKSVFGTGVMNELTAEFDIIVFTPFFTFLIEVKNEKYTFCRYNERLWKLMNDEEVSNPISQNQGHKKVFCSVMPIPRERVVTIEVLLENGSEGARKTGCQTHFPNDYVLGKERLPDCLKKIFRHPSSNDILDVEYLCSTFTDLASKYEGRKKKHIQNLQRTVKIEKRIKNVVDRGILRRTDIVLCEKCKTGMMVFREAQYPSKGKTRNSMHFFLGCSNHFDDNIKCDNKIYVDREKSSEAFRNIKPIRIEQRFGWNEEETNVMPPLVLV